MPVNKHLSWQEINDFTPGYFDVGEWLMPANGSQTMNDCRPDPGGGLRAAGKPTAFTTSGLPSTGVLLGLYSRGNITSLVGGSGPRSDRYLALYDTSGGAVKIYRCNEALNPAATSWTLIKTHAVGSTAPSPVTFDTFVDSTHSTHVVWNLHQSISHADGDGLWALQFSYQSGQGSSAVDDQGVTATRSVTKRKDGFCTAVGVQDDILIAAIGAGTTTLYWTASQDITSFPAPNTLLVQASRQGSVVTSITPYAPGDLLLSTQWSPWTMIQGGISDPIVRTMSDARTPMFSQHTVMTEGGLAFITHRLGVCLTSSGDSFTDLSTQIAPRTWIEDNSPAIGDGNVTYGNNFLVAPHGLWYDFRTHGWHRSSLVTAGHYSWYDGFARDFFVGTHSTGFSLYVYDVDEETRWDTYTWKSAPMRRPERNTRIREVQIVTKSYHADSTLAVTVGGVTHTTAAIGTGRQIVPVLFDAYDEMLDVQVVPNSTHAGTEAPSIEAVRVGSIDQHQTI